MTNFYRVLRPRYTRAANASVDAPFNVELNHIGVVPARSVTDALVIAKALGHLTPIVEPLVPQQPKEVEQ